METGDSVVKDVRDGDVLSSNRALWEAGIRKKYPDEDFSDEDNLYGVAMRGYDAEHDYRKRNEASNKKMYDLLTSNPDVAMFIGSLVAEPDNIGKAVSYIKDVVDLKEGTPEYESYRKQVSERKERERKAEEALREYEENLEQSAETLKRFASENGMSEEEAVKFVNDITEALSEKLFSGRIDRDFLDKLYKVFNYDAQIATATESGRIAGRNEEIDKRRSRLKRGDGLPDIHPSGTAVDAEDKSVSDGTLSALNEMVRRNERKRQMFG